MDIQCLLIRKGGTFAEFGGKEYHFAPNDLGDHVAHVDDDAAISRFLSIDPPAYRIYRRTADAQAAPAVDETPVAPVQAATDADPAGANTDQSPDPASSGQDDESGFHSADTNRDGTVTRAEAKARYVSVFGKNPANKWSVDEIIDRTDAELKARG